jgi:dihydropteroate synthase
VEAGPELWAVRGGSIGLDRPAVLGVLNLTPDSFSDGGKIRGVEEALNEGIRMREEGADLIDVGGESSRPGAHPVNAEEEWARIGATVGALAVAGLQVSVDTTKREVARRSIDAGAVAINDISGLRDDSAIADLCGRTGAGLVIMHMRGNPGTMQENTRYQDLFGEISGALERSATLAVEHGVRAEQIVVDPGIGFGKSVAGNLEIIAHGGRFCSGRYPVMLGPSRKSFLGKLLDVDVDERLEGTIAACVAGLMAGARLFRVHDVLPVRRALDVAWAVHEVGH